ncbi:hypothetical protein [Fervidobacterium sp. 2310opik-2]|uniref:hypothetical protein n=1 Tax=Fervidobacterium sp. 2310opik-2 TaxID=1755815 RepID=UPI0013DF4138|nr:hypothetical protein [Fervidobacterium sp. 2310opik-2]KAF2961201.1 hypothetical protein AS161_02090 [Fervidobacterium sp. 2310opik-2]
MKVPNFTFWFIIIVFVIGGLAIYVYEHFRYSPFALQVDFEVVKEYIYDRHVECYNPNFRTKFRTRNVQFNSRMTPYQFAVNVAPVLSELNDGTTRIEIPIRRVDKILPLKFKYIDNEVFVYETNCEIPEGSKIISINGEPIDTILERYAKLYPNLSEFEAKYAFVEKLLTYYLKIIDANSIQIVYKSPQSSVQKTTYLKGIEKFQEKRNIIDLIKLDESLVVKINSFKISSKEDMQYVAQKMEEIAGESSDSSITIFDLRYASDGDETIPLAIISMLISQPEKLYQELYVRYRDHLVKKDQIPIQPDENQLPGKVYFLVDKTCLYTPHKVLLSFFAKSGEKNNNVTIISSDNEYNFPNVFYVDEIVKILPNTKAHLIIPTGKVLANDIPDIQINEDLKLTCEELINLDSYRIYSEKIAKIIENIGR